MKQKGIVKLIILVVVAILALSYFGINIKNVAESDTGRANFGYIGNLLSQLWTWLVSLWHQYAPSYLTSFKLF